MGWESREYGARASGKKGKVIGLEHILQEKKAGPDCNCNIAMGDTWLMSHSPAHRPNRSTLNFSS